MATKTEVVYIDDVDGGPADETVELTYRDTAWTIDLSKAHVAELDKDIASWTQYAAKASGGGRSHTATGSVPAGKRHRASRADDEYNTRVREWAKANGVAVATRGRIPTAAVDAYKAANGGRKASKRSA